MELKERFGPIPDETGLRHRMRIHQGWWRANVLNALPGAHPTRKDEKICNTIPDDGHAGRNFLNDQTLLAVNKTLAERNGSGAGMMEEDRLFHNLLSSQPLSFNFFGPLVMYGELGLRIIKKLWPEVTSLTAIHFESAPSNGPRPDNSAFDIALEVTIGDSPALIGLECKYTDSFSSTEYDKPAYRDLFKGSKFFHASYDELKASKYNQLFRGQLLAERLLREGHYSIVRTGLFCHEMDESAIKTGRKFQGMLVDGDRAFSIVTYADFICAAQSLDLTWAEREWTMLLWARYSGLSLSDNVHDALMG